MHFSPIIIVHMPIGCGFNGVSGCGLDGVSHGNIRHNTSLTTSNTGVSSASDVDIRQMKIAKCTRRNFILISISTCQK